MNIHTFINLNRSESENSLEEKDEKDEKYSKMQN